MMLTDSEHAALLSVLRRLLAPPPTPNVNPPPWQPALEPLQSAWHALAPAPTGRPAVPFEMKMNTIGRLGSVTVREFANALGLNKPTARQFLRDQYLAG